MNARGELESGRSKSSIHSRRDLITDQEVNDILKKADEKLKDKSTGGYLQTNAEKSKDKLTTDHSKKNSQPVKAKSQTIDSHVNVEKTRDRMATSRLQKDSGVTTGKTTGVQRNSEKPKEISQTANLQRNSEERKERTNTSGLQSNAEDAKEKSTTAGLSGNFGELEPYTDHSIGEAEAERERISIGRIVGDILEAIWTLFKLAVVVGIVTIVAGFLLSRDLMIRGRNGNRLSLESMPVSGSVSSNKSAEDERVRDWLGKVKREKLTLTADDKSVLVARQIVVSADADKWVVILHGYNGNMEDVYDIAMHYAQQGYNVLTPDLRGNGESEGMFLGMGWLDRLDIINWIDVILGQNPSAQIVVHGVDVGADAALMLSGEPVKSSIKAIVAEGAYTTAWDIVKKEYTKRHEKLPVFPFMNMMNPVMKVWAGYTLKEADAVKQVKNTSIPILLIRGGKDTYASEDMTQELNQAIASSHEVFTIPTGTHADGRYAEPDNYYNKTFEFVGKYIK